MRYTSYFLTLALVVIAMHSVGCVAPLDDRLGNGEEPGAPTDTQTTDTQTNGDTETEPEMLSMTMSVAPFLSYSAFYIALEEGYFAEEGLAIETVFFERPSNAIPLLVQGEIDAMGSNISSALLNTIARDANIRLVAAAVQKLEGECPTTGFVLRHGTVLDEQEEITAEVLRALRYHIPPGTTSAMSLDLFLDQYGVSLDEVTIIDFPGPSAWMGPIQEGTVDVVSAAEPWITRIRDIGAADLWWAQDEFTPNADHSGVVFGPTILENNPEIGERFMVGLLRGKQQLAEGKTERNLEILEQYLELDRELLEAVCLPSTIPDSTIIPESIEAFTQWATEHDFIDQSLTADQFWDPRFVEHANRVVGNE